MIHLRDKELRCLLVGFAVGVNFTLLLVRYFVK